MTASLFEVVVEPNRRRILDLLRDSDRSVGDLVDALDIAQPTVSKHLKALREAGLVIVRPDAQKRWYQLRSEPLRELDVWLEPYRAAWSDRFDAPPRQDGGAMTSVTNDEASMGEVLRDGERVALRFVRRFAHPVERVWAAVTESDQLRFWMPCDIVGERRAGADITLPFWPAQVERYQLEETTLTGRIEVWEPPAVFQWTWGGDILRFELKSSTGGTTMTFTTWLESPDLDGAADAAGGYHVCLNQLRVLLDTGSAPSLVESDEAARRLQSEYAKQLAVG